MHYTNKTKVNLEMTWTESLGTCVTSFALFVFSRGWGGYKRGCAEVDEQRAIHCLPRGHWWRYQRDGRRQKVPCHHSRRSRRNRQNGCQQPVGSCGHMQIVCVCVSVCLSVCVTIPKSILRNVLYVCNFILLLRLILLQNNNLIPNSAIAELALCTTWL